MPDEAVFLKRLKAGVHRIVVRLRQRRLDGDVALPDETLHRFVGEQDGVAH